MNMSWTLQSIFILFLPFQSNDTYLQEHKNFEIGSKKLDSVLKIIFCFVQNQQDWDSLLLAAAFTLNTSKTDTTRYIPFPRDRGWTPRFSIDPLCNRWDALQSLSDFQKSLAISFEDAHYSHKLASARQSAFNAEWYQPRSYKISDEVRVSGR